MTRYTAAHLRGSRYFLTTAAAAAAATTAIAVLAAGLFSVTVVPRHTAGCLRTGNRRRRWQILRLPVLR